MKYILLSCCFLLNLYSNNSLSYNLEKINFQEEKLETFAYETKENNLNLTQEQKEYLKDKKELKLCVDPNWLPLEKIENNEHIGITSDFFKLISQMIETPISLVETKEWTESLEKIKRRECDILSLAEKTPSREKYLNFTKPYFSAPLVIVTKVGIPFVDNLNSIKEKSLAIVKNYSMQELLKNKYPLYQFKLANSSLSSSIDEKFQQIEWILYCFSSLSVVTACFLLGVVLYLMVIKRKKYFFFNF